MKKISEILQEIEEEERQEIVKTYDYCIEAICCEEIDWQSFIVYKESEDIVKNMLITMQPQYIMTVCDQIKELKNEERIVKLSVIEKKRDDVQVWTTKGNLNVMIAVIEISQKFKKDLEKKKKQ